MALEDLGLSKKDLAEKLNRTPALGVAILTVLSAITLVLGLAWALVVVFGDMG